jgi:hypothetical protein
MFNEREALRLRLEQLNEAEVKVIREYQIERDNIYAKLRELDRPSSFNNDTKKDFRTERKTESLPVLAELAAQEMKSYQQQQQHAASISKNSAADFSASLRTACRNSRRYNDKAQKGDGTSGLKSCKTA